MKKISIHGICFVALFVAIRSVLSSMTIATPWGVPFTLQTFAVALAGCVLGRRYGCASTVVYIILGCVGVPVFAGMSAGIGVLAGPTGGYIIGFVFLTLLTGFSVFFYERKANLLLVLLLNVLGLAACHVPGVIWLKHVASMSWYSALCVGTLPYLVKDLVSMGVAFYAGIKIRKVLRVAGLIEKLG